MALVHKKEVGKQTSGQNIKGENRFENGAPPAAIAGRLCEGHVTLRNTQRFKTKVSSAPVPGLLTLLMKLHGSDNRGGIIVKTYKEHLLTLEWSVC